MTEKRVIVLGDKTSHGGTVITGCDTFEICGKPVACMNDNVSCPLHGNTIILEGFQTILIHPNKVLAYDGCKTSCGATLIAGGQDVFFVDVSTTNHLANTKEKPPSESWKNPDKLPENIKQALRKAMVRENISEENFQDLAWIMAQESGGRVDVRNSHSSARGLYQLTRANYFYNPHGESSFGNAIEECQGGIRYIYKRYHTPQHAVEFWKSHKWY